MKIYFNWTMTQLLKSLSPLSTITAEMVFSLDASDEFLRQRVMNLPEKTVAGTHYTEEGVCLQFAIVLSVCGCVLSKWNLMQTVASQPFTH